jgi:deoxyribodipyrimidine photo-lyase
MARTIVWFRHDLRIADHEPLERAARRGEVIPVFIFDRYLIHHPEACVAQIAFQIEVLRALDLELQTLGSRLIIRTGNPVEILPELIATSRSEGIYAYTDCDRIYGRVRDAKLNRVLSQQQMQIRWFEPPGSIAELIPYPEYRELWHSQMNGAIAPKPTQIITPLEIESEPIPTLEQLGLIADSKVIPLGSSEIPKNLLREFFELKAESYYWQLSYPGAEATTGLSPYIKLGVISLREAVQFAQKYLNSGDLRIRRSSKQLISRLRWASGFHQRFRYLPQLELKSLYTVFDREGWEGDRQLYQAWQEGKTGFPIIDAAARCLTATGGWKGLNFRSRAIYASFLSNLLGIDWRYGALHFMRHLLDGDCAIDHYQWAMQSGVTHCLDKSWTRIYNPGEVAIARCDPEGKFIKHWLPELANTTVEKLAEATIPMLDYQKARAKRVKQLERLRSEFRQQQDIVPYLARLPESYLPFGSDCVACDVSWAEELNQELFPAPLNLEMDLESDRSHLSEVLRTWLVTNVEIQPHRAKAPKSTKIAELNHNQLLLELNL